MHFGILLVLFHEHIYILNIIVCSTYKVKNVVWFIMNYITLKIIKNHIILGPQSTPKKSHFDNIEIFLWFIIILNQNKHFHRGLLLHENNNWNGLGQKPDIEQFGSNASSNHFCFQIYQRGQSRWGARTKNYVLWLNITIIK